MTQEKEKFDAITATICGKHKDLNAIQCFELNSKFNLGCLNYNKCRIGEKTNEQLNFVLHPIEQNSFLRACAGSGKTEVVGLKAAYEIRKWTQRYAGIAILTFTNNAASVIRERALQFAGSTRASYPHFVGTFDSWLHGYIANPFLHIITQYRGRDNDRSLKIVDDRSEADFLNAFRTKYQYWETGYVKANEFSFENKAKIVFSSANQLLDQIRNKNQASMEDWRRTDLIDTKKKFWQAGFANYEDVEYLCFRLLDKRKDIADAISKRFPLILIDECQDLSDSQLQIVQKLLDHRSNVHFVGDLNQGIYSFRHVNSDLVRLFVQKNNFLQSKLTNNFRSFQPIVDFGGKLVEQGAVTGRQYDGKASICLYIAYEKQAIGLLPDRFIKFLNSRKISVSDSAILTRNNNTVAKLRPTIGTDLKISLLPAATIKVWQVQNISVDQIAEALTCMGKFMAHRYFSSDSANKMSHHCPVSIKSQISWRLFISDLLDLCASHEKLSNLELTWKEWADQFRKDFDNLIIKCQSKHNNDIQITSSLASSKYSAPKGESTKTVSSTLSIIESTLSQQIRITNFHQIKGETKEAIMVVSTPTNAGRSEGYWKNWLADKQSENARFAYVASSRPQKLLVWAIPAPITTEDKTVLENLGMKYISDF